MTKPVRIKPAAPSADGNQAAAHAEGESWQHPRLQASRWEQSGRKQLPFHLKPCRQPGLLHPCVLARALLPLSYKLLHRGLYKQEWRHIYCYPSVGISLSISDAEQKGGAGGKHEAASGSPGTEAQCPEPLRSACAQLISAPQAPLVVPIEALVAPETHQLEGKQVGKKDLHLLRCRILRGDTRRSCTPCLGGDLPQLVNIVGEKSAEQVVAIQFTGCVPRLLSAFQHRSNKPSS